MNNLFEKARDLANNLLETEAGKKYKIGRDNFEANENAKALMQEYAQKSQAFQMQMQMGANEDDMAKEQDSLQSLVEKMQSNSIITELFEAEGEFHKVLNEVMGVFNSTIIGESKENGCSSGGCGGCGGGCH